jgi:hypothetical protein
MSNPRECLLAGLELVQSYSSASFAYLKDGTTPVTCSVYDSFGHSQTYETVESGYDRVFSDKSVIAKTSDVGTWGIEPKKSLVYLNGVPYLVGGVVTYTDIYQWISLRAYTHSG